MKGIIYTRVSSDEQVKGMSLEFQKEDCLRYARDRNISVVKIFEERGESAKFADRPELINMLEYCRENKGKIDVLILWKLDRLSRNQMDYYFIKRTLLDYRVSIHSATEPSLGDSSSIAGKVFETFSALQAEIDNTIRRERAVRGMEAKIMSGIYPWKPPLGYRCAQNRLKGLKKTEPDEPDDERFPLIQRLFRTCLENHICGSVELAELANKWGLMTETGKEVYPQLIDRIMGNKFYAGLLFNPWKNVDVEGKHQRVISPEEFYKVQWLRTGKHPFQFQERRVEHPDFPLRKTVKCGNCLAPLTGSWSKGNGGKYAYYHCHNKQCDMYGKAIKKIELEKAFLKKLSEVTPKARVLNLFEAVVLDEWERRGKTLEDVAQRNKKQLKDLEEEMDGLIKMKVKNLLSDEEFLTRKEKLNNKIAGAMVSSGESQIDKFDIESVIAYAKSFISNLPRQWFDMSHETRKRFQKRVFPEGIPYNRGIGFGTTKLGVIYELIEQSHGSKSQLVRLVCATWNQVIEELLIISRIEEREICFEWRGDSTIAA